MKVRLLRVVCNGFPVPASAACYWPAAREIPEGYEELEIVSGAGNPFLHPFPGPTGHGSFATPAVTEPVTACNHITGVCTDRNGTVTCYQSQRSMMPDEPYRFCPDCGTDFTSEGGRDQRTNPEGNRSANRPEATTTPPSASSGEQSPARACPGTQPPRV